MGSEDTFRRDGGINCPSPEPGAGAPIARGPDAAGELPAPPANDRFKRLKDFFSFENRCMVCGRKFSPGSGFDTSHKVQHLGSHVEEGVLVKHKAAALVLYEQVKAHPVGFPGILLPKEMEWDK